MGGCAGRGSSLIDNWKIINNKNTDNMKKVLCFAAAMALFAGCQKTEIVYDNDGPQEIAFFAVNKVATKTPVAGTEYPTAYNMEVAAYLADGGTAAGDFFPKTTFTSKAQGTSPETYRWTGARYWPITNSDFKVNFLAVSTPPTGYAGAGSVSTEFSSTDYASGATVTFAGNDSNFNQFDLMYAAGYGFQTDENRYPDVAMVFHHALAWINFTVATNTTDAEIKVNEIKLNGAHYGGTLALTNTKYNDTAGAYATSDAVAVTTESWTGHTAAVNVTVPNADGTGAATAVDCTIATSERKAFGNGLMVVPKEYTSAYPSFTVNYTLTQGGTATTYNYTHYFAESGSFEWEPDTKYTYNITFNLNEIKVAPTVDAWTPENATDINL